MGNNSLQTTEKNLRSIAKRYENVKYSVGLAVLFLMKGTSAFSDDNMLQEAEKQKDILTDAKKEKAEVKERKKVAKATQKLKASWANVQFGANDLYSNFFVTPKSEVEKTVLVASADNSSSLPMFAKLSSDIESIDTPTMEEIKVGKENLRDSVGNLKGKIDVARRENNKEINGLRLELIQLMEQGNQVVKSPWASWQFGVNYYYDNWGGTYRGRGDKTEKYPYEGILERDTNEMYRYIATNSAMYSNLSKSTNVRSASTNRRKGLSNYGIASNISQKEPIVSLELNAGISPRVINKKSPNTAPTPPDILLPTFEPKFVNPPVIPNAPHSPTLTLPSFNVNVGSSNNASKKVILGYGDNSLIQEVAITGGDFKIKRNPIRAAYNGTQGTVPSGTPPMWHYSFVNYSGKSPFASVQGGHQFPSTITNAMGGFLWKPLGYSWSGLNEPGTDAENTATPYQKNLAFLAVNKGAMLNNANFLYTNPIMTSQLLKEFVHQDVHGGIATATIRTGIVDSVGSSSSLVTAYDDMVAYQTTAIQQSLVPYSGITEQHTFLNGGKVIIEGANTSLGNTYSHMEGSKVRQSTINTGDIIFQPYSDGTNIFEKNTAVFVISKDTHETISPGTTVPQIQDSINYNAGKIKMYTTNAVGLVADPEQKRPVSLINRDTFELYGENSAAIYLKNAVALDIQTTNDKNFTLDTKDNSNSTLSTNSSYKPIKISGDKSIGLYSVANGSTVEGNFALDIGAIGVGNEKFTTTTISNLTDGVNLTNHSINTSGSTDDIEGSYGILSKSPTDLTSHQIRIFDKAVGNVGVYPADNVELKLGGGSIELNGGSTAKDNIGIYIDGQGAVTSTGSIKLDGGVGNLGIYAKGGNLPTGLSNNVTVREIKGSGTKNTVFIYGSDGAKIKLSDGTLPNGTALSKGATYGLNISNATVDTDASTSNKKDTGAVFATGAGTEISINKIATLSTTASPNINITGTKLTDPGTEKYVGFGLMAKDGATIRAKNNYIKITNGSTAVASVGSGSKVEMNGGKIDYTGKGYALYATPGNTIDISGVKLTLDGNAVAYERDLATSFPIITDTNTSIHVKSKDVVVLNVKHASPLNVSSLVSTVVNSWAGLSTIPTYDIGAINYKMTTID